MICQHKFTCRGDVDFIVDYKTKIIYSHERIAGWSSLVARRAHNPKVGGSNPPPATKKVKGLKALSL